MNKSLGQRIKSRREELKITIDKVSTELKIRPEFIKAIENDNLSLFKSEVYARGFIKNYCKFLDIDTKILDAIYRRDVSIVNFDKNRTGNKHINTNEVFITKNKINLLIIFSFIVLTSIFVLNLINKTFKPPALELFNPINVSAGGNYQQEVFSNTIKISGKTEANTVIKINGVVVPVKADYSFESNLLPVTEENNKYVVEAISNVGSQTKINLNLNKKTTVVEEAEGINGVIQIVKDNALVKVTIDNNENFNLLFFENDSIPIIAEKIIEIETDKPDNIRIYLNNQEFRILKKILRIEKVDGKLKEIQ